MTNRRNYYRILQVQPDAAEAVIRASYRTLMQKLRRHPDLGGDPAEAALINEAYAVLCDARRRAAYDATRDGVDARRRPAGAAAQREVDMGACDPLERRSRCPFCGARCARSAPQVERCTTCDGPLTPPAMDSHGGEGLRGIARIERELQVSVLCEWPVVSPHQATVEDLSPRGMRLRTEARLDPLQVVSVRSDLLDAVAEVVELERGATGAWTVRMAFVTVAFKQRQGGLVTVEA